MIARMHTTALLLALAAAATTPAAAQELLKVSIDQARIVSIDVPAETVIVGNPAIVDVAIHDSRTLILTGRSYGVTNLVALDAKGHAIIDELVSVTSVETASVRVYRQSSRTTYSCAPACEPTVTIGDNSEAFGSAAGQFGTREQLARGSAGN